MGPVPELEATIIKKAAYSYSGYVGHICPFTHQLMAAGVDTHRSTNVPVQASIKLEITTGTVKVEAKQLASVTPQMTAVDIMHFHVKPFTTLKPNLLVDLIPIALSPATKVIKSQSPRKAFEMALGERLGLDLKIKAVTECEVSDKKTVLDSLRNYRYNPILAVIFQGSETALKMNGQPSVRFHRYTVVHNPAASTTKAIEMEIKLAAATKIRNTPLIKHIASRSPMKAMHEEMLDNSIAKLIGSEHILATNALVTVKLMGGAPKTLKLSKTLALGLKDMELKWNVHLEEIRASPRMICVTGLVELPTEVQAIRKFNFQNKIGFGASCEEHAITMNGFTVTSQKQIEYSKRSEAARDCPRISREATELDMQLRTLPEGAEEAKMVQTYGQLVLKREYICGMQRRQETALDQVQIEITATPNLPVQVLTVGRYLDSILKGLLVEYVNQLPNIHNRDMHGVKMIIEFDQRLQALNLKITSPLDTTVFKNIRLPAWIRQILPLHHSTNLVEQVYRAVLGERLYGKCILERGHVHTFDKKTYNYQLDDCYHMVAADCPKRNSHAVLAKEKDNAKHVMIFSENNKIVIEEPATRFTRPTTPFTVKTQTGEERMVSVEVVPDQVAHLLEGQVSVSWARGILIVDTPAHRVIYNGKTLDVMNKAVFAAGDQCGLCGDHNRMRLSDIKSSSQCVHTSLLSMAHSYRVNSAIEQCSPLSSSAVERLSKEGGNLDETQRKDVLRTLESAIVGKVVEKKVKSPGKNGRRSRLKGGYSSDEDFTLSKAKKTPSRKRVASDSESDSGSDSDSFSGIKALKTRIAERRKSTEELISRKSPDTSTTSLRRSIDDTSAKTSQLQCEASPKPSKKTKSDQTKVPSPKSATQPVQPVKTKSSPIKAQSSPGKSQKSPQPSPSKTKRLSKPMTSKKQLASGSKKPINPKSKAAMVDFSEDDDPDVEPFEAFKQSDIDFMLRMKDLYGLKLEKGIDALSISSVTSTELNLAIPVSRMVTIDVDEKGADNLVHNLANYGGNPRIFSAVPDWLAPHLEASRGKEEVEMPTKQEIANHLAKKNKTSKRKAGWDIVVEVVPTGPQPKKSKLEIQLGYDSSFADSLTLSGGRRSRRPNKKYTYGGDESTQSETSIDSSFDMATPQHECTAPKESKRMEPEIRTKEEKLDVSEAKMEVGEEEVELSIGQVDQSCSSVETLEIAEVENEISVESESSSGESLKLFLVDTSDDVDAEIKETSDEAGIGNKDEEVVKEESREEKKVSFAEDVSNTSQPSELSHEEGKNVCVPKPKELQSSTTETNRKVKEEKPNGTLRELRKRRGGAQKNSTESNCISADEGDFYGWASAPPPPRTGWQLLGIELEEEVILEKVGAAFGLDTEDILLPVKDQERSLTMEVIMSPPMIQDTKRVEREESTGMTKKVAFPESDQEERGAQSPSSFGSLKENVPLQCNNNAPLQKQKGGSKRRRSTRDPVLKTNTVV